MLITVMTVHEYYSALLESRLHVYSTRAPITRTFQDFKLNIKYSRSLYNAQLGWVG